jgi:hypothetical protein
MRFDWSSGLNDCRQLHAQARGHAVHEHEIPGATCLKFLKVNLFDENTTWNSYFILFYKNCYFTVSEFKREL